ncbi:DUF1841 family protein [Niveibacterium terrae]|uniref:DUF1841 family protein n=1 Tax=Niveibacterium terrae TaxID=3373598 RepID=UPI003A91F159
MFNPTRDQTRLFFIDAWGKLGRRELLTPLEAMAADIIAHHPEYHALLEAKDSVEREFPPEDGQINPFLHLSLHLAIEEQLSIDQPPGIRALFDAACVRYGERHAAQHDLLEALAETVWTAQRERRAPDGAIYLARARQLAGL